MVYACVAATSETLIAFRHSHGDSSYSSHDARLIRMTDFRSADLENREGQLSSIQSQRILFPSRSCPEIGVFRKGESRDRFVLRGLSSGNQCGAREGVRAHEL